MFKQNLFKHLLSILAVVSITSFAGVGTSYALGDEAVSAEVGDPEENTAEQKEKCEKSGGTWADDVCQCKKANTVEKDGMCVCEDGYKLDGAESLGEENAKCVVDENTETGSTETQTGSDPVGAATGIKIATKSFNDARFSYVRRDLDETIATIRDVVSNAITNTNNIAALQSGKQTRPDDNHSCAEGKTCLLVTDTSGTRNWYEIIDCSVDNFWRNISTNNQGIAPYPTSNSQYSFGYRSSGTNSGLCSESGVGCADNEWVSSWDGYGLIYGVAQRVSIAERPAGTVVTLPNTGVQSGNVCLCKVTGYRPINSGVIAATRTDVSTNSWMVMGYSNAGNSNQDCLNQCGNAYEYYYASVTPSYFAHIANTCSADAPVAQMCRSYPFFATAADSVTSGHHLGWVSADDANFHAQQECDGTGEFAANAHCAETWANAGSFIVSYLSSGQNSTNIGYIYGVCGFATVPSGTSAGDVIDMSVSNIYQSGSGHNAIVCMAKGYKATSDASETNVSLNKAIVIETSENYSSVPDTYSIRTAATVLPATGGTLYPDIQSWYRTLSGICVTY